MRGAIGIGLVWGGYTLGLLGWCMITGRNVSIRQLVDFTTWPPASPAASGSAAAAPSATSTGSGTGDAPTLPGMSQTTGRTATGGV